jgi:hypothetical protein
MLKNKVIIFDDSCPMCKLYTYWFVAWGFLSPENRIGFAAAPADITANIDLVRGRHEIPLYDRVSHETLYGLDALAFVLGSKWTWLKPYFNSRAFKWMFFPLYEIITYNRRVIAGCKACDGFDCAPDLNRFYRSIYLLIATLLIALVGIGISILAPAVSTLVTGILLAFAGHGAICGTIKRIDSGKRAGWNYVGNYATTILMVALSLSPLMIVGEAEVLKAVCIGFATLLGITELRRRSL